ALRAAREERREEVEEVLRVAGAVAVEVGAAADIDADEELGLVVGAAAVHGRAVADQQAERVRAGAEVRDVPVGEHAVDDARVAAGDCRPRVQAAAGVLQAPAGDVGVEGRAGDLHEPVHEGAGRGGGNGGDRRGVIDGDVAGGGGRVPAAIGAGQPDLVGAVGDGGGAGG